MFIFHKNALQGAITDPLCAEYRDEWRRCGNDLEKLVKLSLRQQSIPWFASMCYNRKGLSKEYITDMFKDYINGYVVRDADGVEGFTYGLFVDWDYENDLDINIDVASIMWTVGANIVVKATRCPTLYISNRSNVHLICDGYNTVNVKLFDNSVLTIEDLDANSDVVVYKYSDKARVELGKFCLKEPKIFNKELRL